MPTPRAGETKKKYLDRCMADPEMNSKHAARDERYAVCNSFWDNRGKKHMAQTYSIQVEVFAVGKWNGMEFTREDLQGIAHAFNTLADRHQVPLKMGHNKEQPMTDGQPALGWVTGLAVSGDKLVADFTDVPKIVYNALNSKLYRNVSIELDFGVEYKGDYFPAVLSGVALLGADIPAVNTLADLQAYMGRESGFEFKSSAQFTAEFNKSSRNFTMSGNDEVTMQELKLKVQRLEESNAKLITENTTLKDQLTEQEAKFTVLKAKEEGRAAAEDRKKLYARLDKMVEEKKLTPATRDDFMKQYDEAEKKEMVSFAVDQLEKTIESNPGYFGSEEARARKKREEEEAEEDAATVVLSRTREYLATHKMPDSQFAAAKARVLEADRELADRYAKGGA